MIFVTRPVCVPPRKSAVASGGRDDARRHRVPVGAAGLAPDAQDVSVFISFDRSRATAAYEVPVSSASRFSAPTGTLVHGAPRGPTVSIPALTRGCPSRRRDADVAGPANAP